jgi:hypothetical protein
MPDFALDYRRGERAEFDATARIKPIACLDESDGANLDQVVQLLTAAQMAARDRADERKVSGNQALTQADIRDRTR